MHVPVGRLLLPVQRLLQHQLCEFVPVGLRLHIQVEVVIGGDVVCAQRVGAHVRIECTLKREPGTRGTGRIVIDIHDLYLHAEQLEWAAGTLLADLLPVNSFVDEQNPVLHVHFQVRRPRARHHLEAPRGDFGHVQSKVLGDIPYERAVIRLLRHRVAYLRDHSIRNTQKKE
uniref:Uncharacterized protein n=1 Tax=Salmo trutta TaxID=8032 RepID=A0A674BXZ7_SALTR